jgi:hypothetical protein
MNRKLAIYICGVVSLQAMVYVFALFDHEAGLWLFYFDPRIGLFAPESSPREGTVFPGIASSVSPVEALKKNYAVVQQL